MGSPIKDGRIHSFFPVVKSRESKKEEDDDYYLLLANLYKTNGIF